MARLYQRAGSPFFYIEYRGGTGTIIRESTRLRTDTREDVRAANRLLTQKIEEERQSVVSPVSAKWGNWVLPFLTQHCIRNEATLTTYKARWNTLTLFLRAQDIQFPSQLNYQHAFDYLAWRKADTCPRGKVGHNTAMDEIDLLRMLMNEAVRRDLALRNPLQNIRLKRERRKIRPEISDTDIAIIRNELKDPRWPEWMSIQFEIALYSGRRIAETRIDLSTVNLERGEYTVKVKGGATKRKPIHPELLPLFKRLMDKGQTHTTPENSHKSGNHRWRELFDKLGMPYSFHCIRVTFISLARRAGIDRWTLMQIVDHATVSINEHYNRYSDSDLRESLGKMQVNVPPQTPKPSQE